MQDKDKSKDQLITELKELRQRVAESEKDEEERKRAENEAGTRQDTLVKIFESAPYIMMLVTKDGRVTNINHKGVAFSGTPKEELLGHLYGEVFGCLNSFGSRCCGKTAECQDCQVRTSVTQTFETGQSIYDAEGRMTVRQDSRDIVVEMSISTALIKDKDAEQVLVTIADITERAKQTREIEHLNRLYSVLSRVSQAVVRATSPEKFLEEACRQVVEGGGFLLAWIGQLELTTNAVVPTAFWGGINEYVQGITVYADRRPEGRGPTGTCIREGHPSVHNDFLHSPMTLPWRDRAAPFGIASCAAFPIRRAGGPWGALSIYSDEVDRFGDEDAKLLEKVASDIEFALDNLDREFRRKQAEQKVAELAAIVRSSDDVIIGEKLDGIITSWNLGAEKIYGYTASEVIGKPISILLPPGHEDEVPQILGKIKSGEYIDHYETVRRRKDGRDIHMSLTISPILNDEGRIVAKSTIGRDITERKQAEEALRESETQFRTLVESAPDAIFIEVEGRFAYLNDAAIRLYGAASEKKLLGRDVLERIHPDHRAKVAERIQFINEKRKPTPLIEFKHVKLDGTTVYVESHAVPIRYQKMKGALVFVRDITERKKAEEDLSLSEDRYRRLFEDASLGIFRTSLEGKIIHVNRAFARMFGFDSPEEAKSQVNDVAVDLYVDPSRRQKIVRMILDTKGPVRVENIYRRKDGSISEADLHAWAVHDKEGKLLYLEGFVEDISERKRAEEEKEKLETQLRQSQKVEAIGLLAGGIAHDFNNILQPIIGYTEMQLLELSPSSPQRENLEQVLNASLRAKELIRQILVVSRSTQEQQRIPMDLSLIIKEALKLLRSSLPASIEMKQKIRKGVALADPTQIHQVLMNLCTNAAHSMDGKGILEVRLSPVDLSECDLADQSIFDLKPGPYLRLTVSDTGCGMDAETMERIFDPYFTTKDVGKGSGMGLAVVNGIVKRHQGAVTVQSGPGKGATFTIYIPRVDVEPEATMQFEDLPLHGSERILLVDDEPAVIAMAAIMLGQLGYKLTSRTDSVDALEVFRSSPDEFDLVITDYTMPKLTGLDFASELMRLRHDIPILLCTGFSEKMTSGHVKELGIELLMKPYNVRQISQAVRRILDARKGG